MHNTKSPFHYTYYKKSILLFVFTSDFRYDRIAVKFGDVSSLTLKQD